MGRSYKRKTTKIDPERLRRAILDVCKGMPLKTASRIYEVPRTSLRRQSAFNRGEILTPSTASNTPAEAVSPKQPESMASLRFEDIVIRDAGRKTVCPPKNGANNKVSDQGSSPAPRPGSSSTILPTRPEKRTRVQKVVSYFESDLDSD